MEPNQTLKTTYKIKNYVALISQSGTNNPIAAIVKNDFTEDLEWERTDIGWYRLKTTNGESIFAGDQTIVFTQSTITRTIIEITRSNTQIRLVTYLDGVAADGKLSSTAIQIQVYSIN